MAEAWESLPDVAPGGSWEDLPDVAPVGPPPSRGSFLDYLKSKWSGEKDPTGLPEGVRRVETPTGLAHLTAEGAPFLPPDESQQMADANAAKFKQRVLEGGLSTLSGGGKLMDEMSGAAKVPGAIDQYVSDTAFGRPTTSPLDVYRKERNSVRRDVDSATRNASPSFELGGQQVPVLPLIGSAIPSMLAPLPVGAGARILGGGVTSALDALGGSEADVTRGDVGGLARDVGTAGALGLGVSGAAEGLAIPARAIARGAAARIGDVVSGQAGRDVARVADEVAHLGGVARAETQKGSRLTENVLRRANGLQVDPATVSDPVQRRAIAMLDEQAFKDLANSVATNSMDDVAGQTARIAAAKAAAKSAAASAAQDASDRTRDYFAQSTWGTQIQPRLVTLSENAALGGMAGGATGGAAGLVRGGLGDLFEGAISGLGGSALSGGSGFKTLAKNAMASPLVQTSALSGLNTAARATSSGFGAAARTGAVVSSTAGQGAQQAQQTAFEQLAARFGINAKSKEELANEAFVKGQTDPRIQRKP